MAVLMLLFNSRLHLMIACVLLDCECRLDGAAPLLPIVQDP